MIIASKGRTTRFPRGSLAICFHNFCKLDNLWFKSVWPAGSQAGYSNFDSRTILNPLELFARELIFDIAGVQRRGRFEQEHLALRFRNGTMLDTARHNDEFAGLDPFFPLPTVFPIIHAEPTLHDQEHFDFVFVVMPGKRALKLDELDQLTIQLAGD